MTKQQKLATLARQMADELQTIVDIFDLPDDWRDRLVELCSDYEATLTKSAGQPPKIDRDVVAQYLEQGKTTTEIAYILQKPRPSVDYVVKQIQGKARHVTKFET